MDHRQRQQGATLLVTLVMLIMLTLFAISAMNTSTDNMKMVGNMQERAHAFDASQDTIELAISTPRFASNPGDAIPNPCGLPNTWCTDVNGDGVNDLQTSLTPTPSCVQARAIKVSELVITGPTSEDVGCTKMQAQGTFAVAGAGDQGNSACANTVWNVTAQTVRMGTTAADTDIDARVTQGIGVRIPEISMAANCP
jgi:type II secretory pathway pseudopilin PulG